MEQFKKDIKGKMDIQNPDMSFCSFMLSLGMLVLSLMTFYNDRDFNNEYFNRQLIYQKLVKNPYSFTNYYDINQYTDLQSFLEGTIAY